MSAVFITATGTDIGKTFVTAGLIRYLRASGREVDALKPVMTGFDPAHPEASDAGVLLTALGRPVTAAEIARISPFRFSAPLSPDMAARRERRDIDFDTLAAFSADAAARARGTLLIEGIGGVMVPLNDRHTVLDWMVALTCPVILVTGSYLGSLSHALTSIDALGPRSIAIRAVVVNETPGSTVPLTDTVATLARFAAPIPVVALPHLPATDTTHPAIAQIAAML
jgi:dethiobiotin synthetase